MSTLRHVYGRVRRRLRWEWQWRSRSHRSSWLVNGPRAQVRAARDDGWIEPGASIVDLGCGIANSSAWLAGVGHEVLAIDYVGDAVRQARARFGDVPGLRLERADLTRPIVCDRTFDMVLDLGCVHQL